MNLAYKKVNTNGEYRKLDEEMDVTFVDGKVYTIQLLFSYPSPSDFARIIETNVLPTSGGFRVSNEKPFAFKKKEGVDLYIKTVNDGVYINLAED